MAGAKSRPDRTQRAPGWWIIGGYSVRQIDLTTWAIEDSDEAQLATAASLTGAERWIVNNVPYFDGWEIVQQ